MVQLRPHLLAVICLFCLAGLGVTPLLHPGLYTAHDIWHQVARLYHYSSLVSLGAMPPRWVFNLAQGYGYPLFFFSYHFPWFFGSALVGLGFSVTTSLKLLFAGSYLAASCNMYWLVFRLTKNKFSSTLAAAVYLWSPYFFLTLYVAATMGTAFLFALLPLLVIGLLYHQRASKILYLECRSWRACTWLECFLCTPSTRIFSAHCGFHKFGRSD